MPVGSAQAWPFGLNESVVRAFERKHGIRIFNLASAGDGSGEFLWRVIQREQLHPKLWIINADDHAADFFAVSIDAFGNSGKSNAGHVMNYNRWRSLMNVIARNLRWRMEYAVKTYLPESISTQLLARPGAYATWRNAETGNIDYTDIPAYMSAANPVISVVRDQNCHTTPEQNALAADYVAKIGGDIVLTLFPHTDQCPGRVAEMAASLDTSVILPPDTNYTAFDQTHLDQRGAIAFSNFFLQALEATPEFAAMLARKATEAND